MKSAGIVAGLLALGAFPGVSRAAEPPSPSDVADEIFRSSGISGGLCSHLGCGDGKLTLELARAGKFIVHAIEPDGASARAARERLRAQSFYGPAWVEEYAAKVLPYAENLVNLMVIEAPARLEVPLEEVARVLCPGGVAFLALEPQGGAGIDENALKTQLSSLGIQDVQVLRERSAWLRLKKPWPADMDEWSHPRHGPDGNAISRDARVGPPRRIRWVAGPLHEASNMVTAGGRLFCAGLIARDAFNGIRLWERGIEPSPMRLGYPAAALPGSVAPVAAGNLLFVFDKGKLRALDAATGQEARSYPEAGSPLEVLHLEGSLIAMDQWSVKAIDVESGKLLWNYSAPEPGSIVAGDGAVFFLEGDLRRGEARALVRLEAKGGKVEWRQAEYSWLRKVKRCSHRRGLLVCEASTYTNDRPGNEIHALDAGSGKQVWERAYEPGMSHYMQARAIHSDGLIWVQNGAKLEGIEPASGALQKTLATGTGHCYPPVATSRYFLAGEMSLTDLESGRVDLNPISKGNCSRDAGFVPANGLIYCAPKHCTCWPLVQGYVALAPSKSDAIVRSQSEEDAEPLIERGSAAEPGAPRLAKEDSGAWPCYRADEWRSAGTASAVPADLKVLWTARLGGWPRDCPADWKENPFLRGPVTPPVIAEGVAVVAQGDQHRVVALDAETGNLRWEFPANGRIDSPPTIWSGLCLFGTRSGWVWCLRAEDGKVAWRLRVAPNEERIISFGQLESPWPVPGSVLVTGGVAYFAGGRHSLSDGGIRVFAADPRTGKVLWRKRITELPMTSFYGGAGLEFDPFDMLVAEARRPGASAGGNGGSNASASGGPDFISLSRWQLSPATGEVSVTWKSGFAHFKAGEPGVMAPRGIWTYGPRPEYVPSGPRPGNPDYIGARPRPLVAFRGGSIFSSTHDKRGVLRRDFSPKDIQEFDDVWFNQRDVPRDARKPGDRTRSQRLERGAGWVAQVFAPGGPADAGGLPPGEISALVLAGDVLFAAGTKGRLVALSAADGKKLAELEVPPPVWDGMAAASGRLYVSTQDGDLLCLGKKE